MVKKKESVAAVHNGNCNDGHSSSSETMLYELKMMKSQISRMENRIAELENLTQENRLLPFKEAVEYLHVSPSLLYKMSCRKELPVYKPGGKLIFFKKADLDNWVQSRCRKKEKEGQ